jgi:uncharacterized protein
MKTETRDSGTLDRLRESKSQILEVARRHGVTSVRVFGSVARREDQAASDIDLLVTVGAETTPWFPAGLVLDLQAMLGRRVEVITEKALNPTLREGILSEAVPL